MSVTEYGPEAPESTEQTAPEQADASFLAVATRQRERALKDAEEEKILAVPRWEVPVRVVYGYPEQGIDPVIRSLEKVSAEGKKPEEKLDANIDLLVACCQRVEWQNPESGDWQSLDPSGAPARMNRRLGELMGVEIPKDVRSPARFATRHLFSPRAKDTGKFVGDVTLLDQGGDVLRWLRGADEAADEALRGE